MSKQAYHGGMTRRLFTHITYISSLIIISMLFPTVASADDPAVEGDGYNFSGIQRVIAFVIDWILIIAPALIILSYVFCAFLWVIAGNNKKMVDKAKKQFITTTITLAVISGYFVFKGIVVAIAGLG